MKKSKTEEQEGNDNGLIEDINQLKRIALGEGAAACQVCGTELPDGAPVTVFAYRPAGQPTYDLAYVSCGESDHDLLTYFTPGVRDLLVDGHVGRCVDSTTDSSWPVLLNPSVRAVSPMDSTTARIAPTELPSNHPTESSTDSPTDPTTDEVAWVYGDALLKRVSENVPHNLPPAGTRETNAGEDEHTATENLPNSDGDSLSEDFNHAKKDADAADDPNGPPTATTGPAGSDAPTPADTDVDADVETSAADDANDPPTNTDTDANSAETTADTEGGEC